MNPVRIELSRDEALLLFEWTRLASRMPPGPPKLRTLRYCSMNDIRRGEWWRCRVFCRGRLFVVEEVVHSRLERRDFRWISAG